MTKPAIAEEDILVYKLLEGLESPYNKFTWKADEVREEPNFNDEEYTEEDLKEGYALNYGFHTLITKQDALLYRSFEGLEDTDLYECVIPKGALYFKNSTQYISNKLYLKSETPIEKLILETVE